MSHLTPTGSGTGADPTASVGLTPVTGAALTLIRSDGAPQLDQGIIPSWTGIHDFAVKITHVTTTSAMTFESNTALSGGAQGGFDFKLTNAGSPPTYVMRWYDHLGALVSTLHRDGNMFIGGVGTDMMIHELLGQVDPTGDWTPTGDWDPSGNWIPTAGIWDWSAIVAADFIVPNNSISLLNHGKHDGVEGDLVMFTTGGVPAYLNASGTGRILTMGAASPAWALHPHNITKSLENPTSSENRLLLYTAKAITVTQFSAVVVGSSSPKVTYQIFHSLNRDGTTLENNLTNSDIATSVTTVDTATLSDATVPANSFIYVKTTTQSGTVLEIGFFMSWTDDST